MVEREEHSGIRFSHNSSYTVRFTGSILKSQNFILAFLSTPIIGYLFLRDVIVEWELAQIIYSLINLCFVIIYFSLSPKVILSRVLVSFFVLMFISFTIGLFNLMYSGQLIPFLVSFNGALQLLVGLWWGSQRNVKLVSVLHVAWIVFFIFAFAEVGNRLTTGNGLSSTLFNSSQVFLLIYIFFGIAERRFLNSAFFLVFCYAILTFFSYFLDMDFAREQYKVIVYIVSSFLMVFSFKFFRRLFSPRFSFLIFIFMVLLVIYLFNTLGGLASELPVSREGSLYYRISIFEHIIDKYVEALPWSIFGFGTGASAYSIPSLLGYSSHSGISDMILEFGFLSVLFLVFSYPLKSDFSRKCWVGIWLFWLSVNLLNNSFVPSSMFQYHTGLTFLGFILAYINRRQYAIYLGLSEFLRRRVFRKKFRF